MQVYRISHQSFINDLQGIGAKKYGGRWNSVGKACIYCSQHLSLAVLEKFVHAQGKADIVNLASITIEIPDTSQLYAIELSKMSKDWRVNITYSQWLGDQILSNIEWLGFIVPSVIVPGESNIVLNPSAAQFSQIVAHKAESFTMDSRLLLKIDG